MKANLLKQSQALLTKKKKMALKSGKRKQRSQKNHVREDQPVEPVHEWKHSFIAFLQVEAFICSIIFRTEEWKMKEQNSI